MNTLEENNETCIICFYQLPKKIKYIVCYTCNKKYHYNCVMDWYNKNKYNERVCPHCMTNDLLFLFDDSPAAERPTEINHLGARLMQAFTDLVGTAAVPAHAGHRYGCP